MSADCPHCGLLVQACGSRVCLPSCRGAVHVSDGSHNCPKTGPGAPQTVAEMPPSPRHRWDQQITYTLKHRSCLACGVTASTFGVGAGRTWSYKAADGRPLGSRSPSCPPSKEARDA